MKDKIGTVVEVQGSAAVVVCHENGRTRRLQARNPLGASPGDKVRIVGDAADLLHSPVLRWGGPLFGLILGLVLGQVAGVKLETGPDPMLLSAILGLAFLIGSIIVIRVGGRAITAGEDAPRIAEILLRNEKE